MKISSQYRGQRTERPQLDALEQRLCGHPLTAPQERNMVELGKNDLVGNGEFLREVFDDVPAGARPFMVSFEGNPADVPPQEWSGWPWQGTPNRAVRLSGSANNYFTLAAFSPDEAGCFRRQKAHFQALYAVMLDDIGTKVAMERLTLPPSWRLETSPDNYQAGYLLSEPLEDGRVADRLMNAIVAAELCDPGASGPMTRLARLPVAVNGKHMPPFGCRMVEWEPALRYSVDDLFNGLQLKMAPAGRPKRQSARPAQERPGEGDPVWIPRPDENSVLVALRDRGLYKAPLGDGKHDITCPWVKEHTGKVNDGTAYFEPDDNWTIGGFKCQHGHCADRHLRDLMRFLGIEDGAARMKPTIRVGNPADNAEIERLGKLSPLEYEREREDAAAQLNIRRVSILDRLVEAARPAAESGAKGLAIELYEPEPWPEPVDGAAVLQEAATIIGRHMVMRAEDVDAVVLWVAHAHLFDSFAHTARLLISAPDAECGKTLLMAHMVGNLVRRPQPVELMKAAPFFRLAAECKPTFLIDEMDVFIKEDSDLLAAVNQGWEPHGGVVRCVGDGFEVRCFSTHCPVVMAGINLSAKLPATTVGRSVVIALERAADDELAPEDVYDARHHRAPLLVIGRKLARFCQDKASAIQAVDPALPPNVRNRLADKWRPLFAVAEVAGSEWPERARKALLAQVDVSEPSRAIQLLMDIKAVWPVGASKLPTEDLIARLCDLEDETWSGYNFRAREPEDRKIQSRQLSRLLKPYNVRPKTIRCELRPEKKPAKGYKLGDLEQAWKRYLPKFYADSPSSYPSQRYNGSTTRVSGDSYPSRQNEGVTDRDGREPHNHAGCNVVTDTAGVSERYTTDDGEEREVIEL